MNEFELATRLHGLAKENLAASLYYYTVSAYILASDAAECFRRTEQHLSSSESATPVFQFWHRSFVRATMAFVEGTLYTMRQQTLHAWDRGDMGDELDLGTRYLLMEKRYSVGKNGIVKARDAFNRIGESLVFSYEQFAKILRSSSRIDTEGEDKDHWKSYLKLKETRNELVHPKGPDSLNLGFDLAKRNSEAFRWIAGKFVDFFKTCDINYIRRKSAACPEVGQLKGAVLDLIERKDEEFGRLRVP